jgi:CRP-like cAMP-binding protein
VENLANQTFRLTDDLVFREMRDGTMLLKQTAVGTYMSVSAADLENLWRFTGISDTGTVLKGLLQQQKSPSIQAFYALVAEALDRGLLTPEEGVAKSDLVPVDWPVPVQPVAVWIATGLVTVPGLYMLLSREFSLPLDMREVGVLLFFSVITLTLSSCLAAAVISGAKCQVYKPTLAWGLGIPYLAYDNRDVFMGGRDLQLQAALFRLAAAGGLALIAAFVDEAAGLAAAVCMLILASPFGTTGMRPALEALFRNTYDTSGSGVHFFRNRFIQQILERGRDVKEDVYLTVFSIYTLLWLGAVLSLVSGLVARQGSTVIHQLAFGATNGERFAAAACVFLVVMLTVGPFSIHIKGVLAPRLFQAEKAIRRLAESQNRSLSTVQITSNLLNHPLFSQLTSDDLSQLAKKIETIKLDEPRDIIREGDEGTTLFLIVHGNVQVLKSNDAGEQMHVATLGPGDVFGEVALLDRVARTATCRNEARAVLLAVDRDQFNQVLRTIGAEEIRTIIQVHGFLKRHPLFAHWPDARSLKLAREFNHRHCEVGEVIIKQGRVNKNFYLVYEGILTAQQAGRTLGALGIGDYCGEISLYRKEKAMADVVALETGRLLCLPGKKFADLITEDPYTGVVLEAVVKGRLQQSKQEGKDG